MKLNYINLYEIIKGKRTFLRYVKWQVFEKALRFFTTIFISFLIANYLSPEDFGKYTYTISILTIWIGTSNLGMNNLIVAQISKYKINQKKIISTFLKIRIISTSLFFLLFIVYSLLNFKLGFFLTLTILFSFLEIFEFYNQGKLRLIANSKSKIIAYLFGFSLKIIAILFFKSYKLALIFYSLEFCLIYFLIYKDSKLDFFEILFSKVESKLLKATLKKMITLSFTPFLVIFINKFDILIIKSKFGFSLLGQYNIFSQVILLWSIFPIMLTNYHLPKLAQIYSTSIEKYHNELKKYGRIYFLIGLFLTLISILVFNVQYGILNYQNNSIYLACTILCFINIPQTISLLQVQIIAINNLQNYGLIKVVIDFLLIIIFSLLLINNIGIIAIPISLNFSSLITTFVLPKFFKNSLRYVV